MIRLLTYDQKTWIHCFNWSYSGKCRWCHCCSLTKVILVVIQTIYSFRSFMKKNVHVHFDYLQPWRWLNLYLLMEKPFTLFNKWFTISRNFCLSDSFNVKIVSVKSKYSRMDQVKFTWSILEYFVPIITHFTSFALSLWLFSSFFRNLWSLFKIYEN